MTTELYSTRAILEELRLAAKRELEPSDSATGPISETGNVDPFHSKEEAARASVDLARRSALRRQQSSKIAEIERALNKLEDGTYGLCDSCGDRIEAGRLEAIPYASLCVACKSGNRDV